LFFLCAGPFSDQGREEALPRMASETRAPNFAPLHPLKDQVKDFPRQAAGQE